MRVVVFTADPHLETTPWWRTLGETPGVEAILVCRRVWSSEPRQVLKRFYRNVRKHGPVFIPLRAWLLVVSVLRRPFRRTASPAPAISVPVEEVESENIHGADVIERVREFMPDLGLSLGAPVLRPSLFRIPVRGTLNIHLGKVPEFRGAPPAFWELVEGATTIGATIHWVDEGLDTGAVVASAEAPIYRQDTLKTVESRVEELGAHLFCDALASVFADNLSPQPQRDGGKTNRSPTVGQRAALATRIWRRRAAERLAPRRILKGALLGSLLWVYRPVRDMVRRVTRRHPVRVFTFHRITWLCRDGMTVNPNVFREQIAYVARHHDIVSLERGVMLVREGVRLSRPAAILTFDDAYRSVFDIARPILQEFGVSGAVFVSTDLVGRSRRFEHDRDSLVREFLDVMTWQEIASLLRSGWSVGAHTASHARLSECSGQRLEHELREPRRAIRAELGVDPDVLAFPFGHEPDISNEAIEGARRTGYSTVFANYDGETLTGTDKLVLGRYDIGADRITLAWKGAVHGIELGRWRALWPK